MTSDIQKAELNREIIQIWKDAGGYFHGPHVEHAVMQYSKWLPFMRDLIERNHRLTQEIEDWRGRLATQCGQTLAARQERDEALRQAKIYLDHSRALLDRVDLCLSRDRDV